jgi:hypothetical protein
LPRSQRRDAVYQHARAIWKQAKTDGLDPATQPEWQPVALLCDLTHAVRATVTDVMVGDQHRLNRLWPTLLI